MQQIRKFEFMYLIAITSCIELKLKLYVVVGGVFFFFLIKDFIMFHFQFVHESLAVFFAGLKWNFFENTLQFPNVMKNLAMT